VAESGPQKGSFDDLAKINRLRGLPSIIKTSTGTGGGRPERVGVVQKQHKQKETFDQSFSMEPEARKESTSEKMASGEREGTHKGFARREGTK